MINKYSKIVTKILKEHAKKDNVTPKDTWNDLGLDSFGIITTLMGLEEAVGFDFPDYIIDKYDRVDVSAYQQLMHIIQDTLAEKTAQ